MFIRKLSVIMPLVLAVTALSWAFAPDLASSQTTVQAPTTRPAALTRKRVTNADRLAAAARAAAQKAATAKAPAAKTPAAGAATTAGNTAKVAAPAALGAAPMPMAAPAPGGTPNYFGPEPNYANSPILSKFVDTLPGLGAANKNNLGQYIPVANPDTVTYPGSDYYEIAVKEYTEVMHSDLSATPTRLRGYVQLNNGTDPTVTNPTQANNTVAPAPIHYLGPIILSRKDRPVRIKFTNLLPTGAAGDLFLPVDTTVMGAGMGPLGMNPPVGGMNYTQNRAVLHLHGGATPWISDGTPHQWITPAGETTSYPKGLSQQNVPDMFFDANGKPVPAGTPGATNDPGPGSATFFYTNQQSSRLMFYHDHSYGITRLNVYAGEAAGYIVTDAAEDALIDAGTIPGAPRGDVYRYGIPLIIQDKTFVPDATTLTAQDPTWNTPKWGGQGNLWFPHVYMTNQNPSDPENVNAMGRWDYGPWFWPPVDPSLLKHPPVASVPGGPLDTPGTPNVSMAMEAFLDTPVVNGTPYPVLKVDRKAYRFRILNGCNDRTLNLQLYYVDPAHPTEVKMVPAVPHLPTDLTWPATWPTDGRDGGVPDPTTAGPSMIQIGTEGGFLPAPAVLPNTPVGYTYNRRDIVVLNVSNKTLFLGPAERADVIVDFSSVPSGSKIILYNDAPAPVPAFDPRYDYYTGNPDLTSTGGAPSTLIGKGPNIRTIMRFEVSGTAAAPFNLPALQTALPAAFKASQPAMIVPQAVYGTQAAPLVSGPYNLALPNIFSKIFDTSLTFDATLLGLQLPAAGQAVARIAVTAGGSGYTSAPAVNFTGGAGAGASATAIVANGVVTGITLIDGGASYTSAPAVSFTGGGGSNAAATAILGTTIPMRPKAIQELFELDYGRMNSTLGVELPFTNFNTQTTIPLGYIDPATEILDNGQVQIWKITHNGVDTHAIHFHLFNVQLVNRVGWDGAIRPPDANELGWKETVRMNPLEDAIVALVPQAPKLPFAIPDSMRPLDPTMPVGDPISVTDSATGNAMTVNNDLTNFGWEYVWHCHLLGHEEMDMMRPMVLTGVTNYILTAAAPSNLAAIVVSTTRVDLTWKDNSNNETGFRIERLTGPGVFTPLTTVGPNVTAFSDTTVVANATYSYRVIAVNGTADSLPSNVVTVTVAAPIAPANLVATPSVLSSLPPTMTLTWSDLSNNETGFTIQRATNSRFTANLVSLASGPNATSFTDATVAAHTRYYYRVRAFNGIGASAFSNSANATTVGMLPAAPTNLVFVSATRTSSTLSWTDNATNESGFQLEYSQAANGPWNRTATVGAATATPPSTKTFVDTGLKRNTLRFYRVRAYNADGTSAYSNTASGSTLP